MLSIFGYVSMIEKQSLQSNIKVAIPSICIVLQIIDQEGKGFITIKQIREMAEKIMPSICSEELESLFDDTLLGEDDSPLRGKNNDDSQKNNGKTQIKDSGDHKNGEGKINAESFIQFIQML